MKKIIEKYIMQVSLLVFAMVLVSSCKKDDYYIDGGRANPKFNGTIVDFLNSNPKFDTISQIVTLAGMEEALSNEELTFFAPTDEVIRRTIGNVNTFGLNSMLFELGKDTIKTLADIDPNIWRKYLTRYIYKGKRLLKDYTQIDFGLRQLYPGSFYYTYNNELSNIGVVYNSANNVKYIGYRQLALSFLSDPTNPQFLQPAAVATSDIQPTNGVVHVLAIYVDNSIGELPFSPLANTFGFDFQFFNDVLLSK